MLPDVFSVDDFDYSIIENASVLKKKRGRRSKHKYLDLVTAFDIETTNIDKYEQSVMYIWQWQIEDKTVIGRNWEEFKYFYQRILNNIPDGVEMVCLVHNLSFEYQFLKSIIPVSSVFAMDTRKILNFRSGAIEFRCTYLHSNMSLDRYLKAMDVPDKKVQGFDYDKKRYPWTRLSEDELLYCINDVRGLVEAYRTEMQRDGDDLYTIPMTATGYARKPAKKALGPYRRWIHPMIPDLDVFQALRKAFRGGNTHANRWHSGEILRGMKLESYDISSSYPSVMLTEYFPTKFYEWDPDRLEYALLHNKACLMLIHMENIHLKDERWGCPYIPKAKCEGILHGEYDNGRVLSADVIEMYITEVDLEIIDMEYEFDFKVMKLWCASKRRLPKAFRNLLLEQYRKKTELKGVDDYLYGKFKSRYNAFYGMSVQNPCKPDYIVQPDGMIEEDMSRSLQDLIDEYQAKGWLPYQWGVWICAYSRLKLELGMLSIPYDDFLYCDTDSIKYKGDHGKVFEELNQKYFRYKDLYAEDKNGKKHYIGVYEKDAEYLAFSSLGAKKYAYEDDSGLHVAISGVNKKIGAEELGSIDKFREGFVFRDAGGTESIYNDDPAIKKIKVQGHELEITSNLYIRDSTYTLGMTTEYRTLLIMLSSTDIRYSLHYER